MWDVIIIGGGAIGASTAHFLKRKDPSCRVLLLEKAEGFGRGATGAWGSLIRVFSIRPGFAERAAKTVPYFLDFERNVGRDCGFVRTGALYFFGEGHEATIVPQVEALQSVCRTPLAIVKAAEGRERFPEFQWLDGDFAIHEPDAGYACPWSTTAAWIGAAAERGLEARTGVAVSRLVAEGDAVTGVELESGERLAARRVLVSGGPWTNALLATIGVTSRAVPRAIQVNRFQFRSGKGALPFFLDLDTRTFARPAEPGTLYGGYLIDDQETDPRAFRQPLSLAEANEAKKRLSKRLKALRTSELAGGIRAVETYTDYGKPVLEFDARFRNLYVATGWSCSGFTLAPHYGEHIAGELLGSLA